MIMKGSILHNFKLIIISFILAITGAATSLSFAQQPMDKTADFGIDVTVSAITIAVTVQKNGGKYINDLEAKDLIVYENSEISEDIKVRIFEAMLRVPTAGNMMLYTVIEVKDQDIKDTLAKTCDNQPFIAKAPLVLLFLADYQRWQNYFMMSEIEHFCEQKKLPIRKPEEGDLFLACCDAIIAAQTAAIAAESFGIGSCYVGDIMENYEVHKKSFNLPQYVFPICLLCFGYPTKQQKEKGLTSRFDKKFIIFKDRYNWLKEEDLREMYEGRQKQTFGDKNSIQSCGNFGQLMYLRKFIASFSIERNRSVRAILKVWKEL